MPYQEIRFSASDGLELYARDYGGAGPAILCLTGLTRNCRDFEPLAELLGRRCRLLTPDYRGRGRSGYASDPRTYRPDIELAEAIALLDLLVIEKFGVIGTSRGGLIAMMMGAAHPGRLIGAVLNDLGPVLEREGLLRISGYVGKAFEGHTWDDAIAALKRTHPGFVMGEAEWTRFAHRVFRDENGVPVLDYDLALARIFPSRDAILSAKDPDLWPLFDSLLGRPVAVLRGENSDLLSPETVDEMARRHPSLDAVTVKDRGHPPFLDEPESIAMIERWLDRLPA
jgi:pimeloyl-ACP methyl ester carboxylesterase